MSEDKVKYDLVQKNDNTLKSFFDKFYVIPKDPKDRMYTDVEIASFKKNEIILSDENVRNGLDGYIVCRGKKKKVFTEKQIQEIQESNLSYRKLSEKFNVSIGTISRVKNNKY